MSVDAATVRRIAHLARIAVAEGEVEHLKDEINAMLAFVEQLQEVDVTGVEPTAHAFPLVNVTRPDEATGSLPHDEALANAPAKAGGLFVMPKIVE